MHLKLQKNEIKVLILLYFCDLRRWNFPFFEFGFGIFVWSAFGFLWEFGCVTTNKFRLDGSRLLNWGKLSLVGSAQAQSWNLLDSFVVTKIKSLYYLDSGLNQDNRVRDIALVQQDPRRNPTAFCLGSQPRPKGIDFLLYLYMPWLKNCYLWTKITAIIYLN